MADQSWFFASQGQQQGPYPEAQLRQFIASRVVTAETLVWTEGMANWQKAGDIPGLFSGPSGPPAFPQSGGPLMNAGGHAGGSLSIDFGIWEFVWRSLVLSFGLIFIIPGPWVILMYCRWIVSCVRVPQRPNLAFTGRLVDLMWFYALVLLVIAAAWTQFKALSFAVDVVQLVVYWLLVKWFIANLSSNGQPLGLQFSGSFWGFLGWSVLAPPFQSSPSSAGRGSMWRKYAGCAVISEARGAMSFSTARGSSFSGARSRSCLASPVLGS